MLIRFTGQHLPSPAGYSATNPGKSDPGKLHFMAQGWQLWRTSGQKAEAPLACTRSCRGRSSPLICATVSHDTLSPLVPWAAHQGIRAPRLHGVGAGQCLRGYSLAHSHASLTANPLRHCHCTSSKHPQGPRRSIQTVSQTTREGWSLTLNKCTALCGNPQKRSQAALDFPRQSPSLLFPSPSNRNATTLQAFMYIFLKRNLPWKTHPLKRQWRSSWWGKGDSLCPRDVCAPPKFEADLIIRVGVFAFQVRESTALSRLLQENCDPNKIKTITLCKAGCWGLINQENNARLVCQRQLNFMKTHFPELTYFANMTTEFSSPSTSHLRGEQSVPVCTHQPISVGDGRGRPFKLVTLH